MSKYPAISDRNPEIDKIRDEGWAFIQTNGFGKYGAPYTDEEYAADAEDRGKEVRIISWE